MSRAVVVCTFGLLLAAALARGDESTAPERIKRCDPRTASLAEAVGDWINLLELESTKAPDTAAQRWAGDEDAAKALRRHWPEQQERHTKFDYRGWIAGGGDGRVVAEDVGDADTFTVGGHDFGHLHVRWMKSADGWRIAAVFVCR